MMLNQALKSSPWTFKIKRCRNVYKCVSDVGLRRKCGMNKSLQKQMVFFKYINILIQSFLKEETVKECLGFFFSSSVFANESG